MKAAAIVCAVMGALWAAGALYGARAPAWTYLGPAAVAAGLLALAARRQGLKATTADDRRRVRLVVLFAFAFECAAIAGGIWWVVHAGRPDLAVSVVAAAVGVHFLPMARWLPAPGYYLTGAALIAAGCIGAPLSADHRYVFVPAAAAAILWTTGFSRILRAA